MDYKSTIAAIKQAPQVWVSARITSDDSYYVKANKKDTLSMLRMAKRDGMIQDEVNAFIGSSDDVYIG